MVNIIYTVNHARDRTADPRLDDTQLLFWSVLEGGLALIAVNLPSIWGLFTGISPEAILRSVRGLVSLRSWGSGGSMEPKTPYTQTEMSPSTSSHARMFHVGGRGHGVEAYAMHDIDCSKRNQQPSLPERIMVRNSITQSSMV